MKLFIVIAASLILALSVSPVQAGIENGDWALTLYGGRLSGDNLGETLLLKARYEDSYLVALALSRRFFTLGDYLDFEAEGQVVQHFREQDNLEANGLIVFRWLPFFWDSFVETSLAAGAGISYALQRPEIEAINHPDTPHLLGYLMLELDFTVSKEAAWRMVARIHHRSGANGLFDGRLDASNAWCLGVKYCF